MQNYVTSVNGGLLNKKNYYTRNIQNKHFFSPLKELGEQTILSEEIECKNDSYRQRSKYNDRIDGYYSSYDLDILLYNQKSYLEGSISSAEDVDYYKFSYGQKTMYEKMGISSKITIHLENSSEECDYDLIVYDKDGNQIGIAKTNSDVSKELTLPDWANNTDYIIRVENRNGETTDTNAFYRIFITEEKSTKSTQTQLQKQNLTEDELSYVESLDKLHEEQYWALSEEKRYQRNKTVEELLECLANGEELSEQELEYIKVFANLYSYEKAYATGKIKNQLYPNITDMLAKGNVNFDGREWDVDIDLSEKITVYGKLTEEEKKTITDILERNFSEKLWDYYMQATDMDAEKYNYISAYHDVASFLKSATNGEYKCEDIFVDENGKIQGLPLRMCEMLNSQESNGRYEQLRDEIYAIFDYQQKHETETFYDFHVKYHATENDFVIL